MKTYIVKWQVQVQARSPQHAVQKVGIEHFDPRSTATEFSVAYEKLTRSKQGPRPGRLIKKKVIERVVLDWSEIPLCAKPRDY
jgi:hypothetical protein